MAPYSSTLAWKIPWTEEPGRLQSMGSRRVGYDWAISLSLFTFMHWRRKWQPTPVFLAWKISWTEDLYELQPKRWQRIGQYSCLENPMDGGACWAAVHGVAKSWTRLSDFTFTFHFHGLEKEMAAHSSVLAWRIPGTGEPGGLPSMGSHRVGHDWSDLAAAAL